MLNLKTINNMNIIPQQLNGKTVIDCYEIDNGKLCMEFNDGTKIKFQANGYYHSTHNVPELQLELQIHSPTYNNTRSKSSKSKPFPNP